MRMSDPQEEKVSRCDSHSSKIDQTFHLDISGFIFFNMNTVVSKELSIRRNKFVPSTFLKKEASL